MTLKNYKELCKVLSVDLKTGRAKQNQLKWFESHFSYKKEGHKFTITDIIKKKKLIPCQVVVEPTM